MDLLTKISALIQASKIDEVEMIQQLWSGYGSIKRYKVEGCNFSSIIVKHVQLSTQKNHPRGWNTDRSHLRKVKSYEVETQWYKHYSHLCDDNMTIPKCLAFDEFNGDVLIIMEDLDQIGFPKRLHQVGWTELNACLKWLAYFHAKFLNHTTNGLWDIGTYWHLDTRPDELEALDDLALKKAASAIDTKLNQAKYKTIVHGDAKLANFCFSADGSKVSAVDFQYIGGGVGMKDVIYFIGSCMSEEECEKYENKLLNTYFSYLQKAILHYHPTIDPSDVIEEWKTLFPIAWTDFHRFLKGWSPGHWKINSYSEKLSQLVIQQFQENGTISGNL
ncbi:oxidoreductase family protein [Flammeovirga sp. SJP92]|uniref:oxidoreductase family protein n=1 Tax=Flammeovirga sp. SJP92 TaxID=1775430 RepID=UPI0007873490|nr:oxidoreductase family protein [Flammeovirga sp. SJP92]KXX71014.1 choline kinase [Flammeovirga sp. SJP92]